LPTNFLFFGGDEIDSFPDQFVVVLLPSKSGRVRVAHHLHETFAVTQIDENDAAMVPPPVYPSAYLYGLAEVFAVYQPAVFATHISIQDPGFWIQERGLRPYPNPY